MTEVQNPKVVLIVYVWPEPQSSAAGLRDMNLIESFLWAGWDLVVASPSQLSPHSEKLAQMGLRTAEIQMNDSSFDEWIRSESPDYVIFDRFVTEEQFGWRVQEQCPNAVRVLDTQDLHFLRRTRSRAVDEGKTIAEIKLSGLDFSSEDTFREVASLYRCDGVFVLSSFEYELLVRHFYYPEQQLSLSRFHYPTPTPAPSFDERAGMMMIGNFRHPPNSDGVKWLVREIWPLIRRLMPEAKLDIYGAYPSREMMVLTSEKQGVCVRGPVQDQFDALKRHRVNLAPLRFGAGIKGKISDAWWSGTPTVSTSMGAEGMTDSFSFGGWIGDTAEEFAHAAVRGSQNSEEWKERQTQGYALIQSLYHSEINQAELIQFLERIRANCASNRAKNWIGSMLGYHAWRSTRYFSRWIEEKSKRLSNDVGQN